MPQLWRCYGKEESNGIGENRTGEITLCLTGDGEKVRGTAENPCFVVGSALDSETVVAGDYGAFPVSRYF